MRFAITSIGLGACCHSQGFLEQAEGHYQRVLEYRQEYDGSDSPATLDAINKLALVFKDQGRIDEAESLCSIAFRDCTRLLGEEHPITQVSSTSKFRAVVTIPITSVMSCRLDYHPITQIMLVFDCSSLVAYATLSSKLHRYIRLPAIRLCRLGCHPITQVRLPSNYICKVSYVTLSRRL